MMLFSSRFLVGVVYAKHGMTPITHEEMLTSCREANVELDMRTTILIYLVLRQGEDNMWRILVPEDVAKECMATMLKGRANEC